jgi:GNAT superfamily N-acetyltransferase
MLKFESIGSSSEEIDRYTRLLRAVEINYPNGKKWLNQKLRSGSGETERLKVLDSNQNVIAVMICQKKFERRKKISTFYVCSAFRRKGIGSLILKAYAIQAAKNGFEKLYITHNENRLAYFSQFLRANHFATIAFCKSRYREDESEVVSEIDLLSSSILSGSVE